MATNQTTVTETPDDIIRPFLINMKMVLNIKDFIFYLLSENAIGDDDPPKLMVSSRLSKNDALFNLMKIITTRGTTEQFMRALERSSEFDAGQKELYDKMVQERQRRRSASNQRSSTSRQTRNSITSQTQLIPVLETSSQADPPSSEEPPPTVIIAKSAGASVTHSTSAASPSNTGTGQDTETAPSVCRASQPQTVESAAADNHQHPEIKSFWIVWLFGGLCTCAIALTLAALAITTIVYGALGIQGKDKCGFSDIRVGAYDVSSGGLLLLLIILVVILMILYTSHICKAYQCYLFMLGSVIVLAVIVVLGIAANVLFSFISVAKVVYGDYEMWNPSNIDCSSPSFFSAFTYVTVELVLIAAIIVIVCGFLYYCCAGSVVLPVGVTEESRPSRPLYESSQDCSYRDAYEENNQHSAKAERISPAVPLLDCQTLDNAITVDQFSCYEDLTVEASLINLPHMEVAIEGPRSDIPQEQGLIGPNLNIETSGVPFNVHLESGADNYQSPKASLPKVNQTIYFSTAKNTANVPFLDHQMLECDFNGREYTNVDHDITLRIPEGAVAEGEKIHFEVGVAMYGPFTFPDNTQPISPILWLCVLEGDAELRNPFQIVLPHYLTGLSKEKIEHHQIGLAKANHKDYTFIDTETSFIVAYKFHRCVTRPLLASTGYRSYGVLVSKHCCFYCLTAKKSPELAFDAGYCLVRIESCISPQRNEFYFAAIYFLETCLRSLEEQFPREEGYRMSRHDSFKFKRTTDPGSFIQIAVPAKNDQCLVGFEPLHAKITVSDIISFWNEKYEIMKLKHERNMYPPRVKMTVSMNTPNHSITLPVRFLGCEGDDKLDVELTLPLGLPPLSPTSSFSGSHNSEPRSPAVVCGRPELKVVFKKLLPLATHWKTIGTLLGVSKPVLDKIKSDEEGANDRLQEMLSEWLKQVDPPPSWSALADAVEAVDSSKTMEIRKHCLDMPINY